MLRVWRVWWCGAGLAVGAAVFQTCHLRPVHAQDSSPQVLKPSGQPSKKIQVLHPPELQTRTLDTSRSSQALSEAHRKPPEPCSPQALTARASEKQPATATVDSTLSYPVTEEDNTFGSQYASYSFQPMYLSTVPPLRSSQGAHAHVARIECHDLDPS
ncbi:hypothetical protein K438DRAFT_1784709 [Mycena galopus ATCC 62051]|nr:hypothetical protein K438DRAFT_1784709 [Mycena galopus ATCC 62051]